MWLMGLIHILEHEGSIAANYPAPDKRRYRTCGYAGYLERQTLKLRIQLGSLLSRTGQSPLVLR